MDKSSGIFKTYDMSNCFKSCVECNREMNVIDDHEKCYRHRLCVKEFPCSVCKMWSDEKWVAVSRMIDKAHESASKKSATVTSASKDGNTVSSVGNVASVSQASSVGSRMPQALSAGMQNVGNPTVVPSAPPPLFFNMADWQKQQEALMMQLIDARVREVVSQNVPDVSNIQSGPNPSILTRESSDRAMPTSEVRTLPTSRFSRFQPSDLISQASGSDGDQNDVIELTDRDDSRSILSTVDTVHSDSAATCIDTQSNVDFQKFINKVSRELHIDLESVSSSKTENFKSYVSDRLTSQTAKPPRSALPLDGFVLQTLAEVDNEFQKKGHIRTYRATDDDRYLVSSDHFDRFCSTPRLDDNIEEGMLNVGRKGSSRRSYRFRNQQLHSRNQEFRKIDQASRLLLRELSYGSMITSYLDTVVSDDDKTEALQALMQVFKSMADVTSRIMVGSVSARRAIHIEDFAFKNKATENKLFVQSTFGSRLFYGKYFDILHSSAENLRDAKETQHLRTAKKDSTSEDSSRKRKREDNSSSTNNASANKKGKFDDRNDRNSGNQRNRGNRFSSGTKNSSRGQNRSGFRPQK